MKTRIARLPLTLALLLAFGLAQPLPARAGQPDVVTAGDAATEAFVARRAKLPAPSAEGGFTFAGSLRVVDGPWTPAPQGVMHISAEPADVAGAKGWRVKDEMSLDLTVLGLKVIRSTSEVLLDAQLRPVSGTWHHSDERGNASHMRLETLADGQLAFRPIVDGVEGEAVITAPEYGAMAGIASLALFAHLTVGEDLDVPYAASVVRGPHEDERFERADWTMSDGRMDGLKALLVASRRGDDTLDVYFDPITREVLGGTFGGGGKPFSMQFRPGMIEEQPEAPVDDTPRGAETAKAAGLLAALGFGTGDVAVLDRAFHWPSIHAQVLKNNAPPEGEPAPTVEELRARVMMNMGKSMPKNPAAIIEGALQMIDAEIVVEMDGEDRGTVVFPAAFQGLRLVVGRHDGRWFLIELPGQPGN